MTDDNPGSMIEALMMAARSGGDDNERVDRRSPRWLQLGDHWATKLKTLGLAETDMTRTENGSIRLTTAGYAELARLTAPRIAKDEAKL